MSTLSFVAAVVPILAGLYSGASYLHEQAELKREQRVRYRIAHLREDVGQRLRAQLRRQGESEYSGPGAMKVSQWLNGFEDRMLSYNGVRPGRPTIRDGNVRLSMSGSVESARELRRQRVLLCASAVGVLLLALDGM